MARTDKLSAVERKKLAVTPERRAQLQARMLRAVEDLLRSGASYPQISVERLIRTAGISRATFYIYFEDKGALLERLAEAVVAQLIQRSDAWWSLTRARSRSELLSALQPVVEYYREHALLLGAVADTAPADERLRRRMASLVDTASTTFAVALRGGQESGGVRQEVDPDTIAPWLIVMAEQGMRTLVATADDASAQRYLESLADVLWFTLYAVDGA